MCAPQPPSNLSPLACQSQKQTGTSTSNLKEKNTHLLCQKAGGSRPFLFYLFPGGWGCFAVSKSCLSCAATFIWKRTCSIQTLAAESWIFLVKTWYQNSQTALLKSKVSFPQAHYHWNTVELIQLIHSFLHFGGVFSVNHPPHAGKDAFYASGTRPL